jgi:hypothetical protein
VWHSAVVLAAVVAVPLSSGFAAATVENAVPSRLVGKWTRAITKADVRRASGALVLLAGKTATFTVAKNGHCKLDEGLGGNLGTTEGTVVPTGPDRIRITIDVGTAGIYTWRVSGKTLTLTKLKDSNPNSVAVFWGVWKRR